MNHIQICFYRPGDKFGCFANFSKHTVFYNNVLFKTSEHAFQAMKFYPNNLDIFEQVKNATTPKKAAIMGRSLSPIRADWESEITSDISCITLVNTPPPNRRFGRGFSDFTPKARSVPESS